jgi:hypothetical protein
MQIVFYAAIALGLLVVVRSSSLASLYRKLMLLRDEECIPRIVEQQKACDKMITVYYLVSIFIGLWIAGLGIYNAFAECVPAWMTLYVPAGLCVLYVGYYVYRASQIRKFDLVRFYDDMNKYRKAQKVVTPDNDHEVNFIRGFKEASKQSKLMLFWIALTLAISSYFIFIV